MDYVMVIPDSVVVPMVRQACYMCGAEFSMTQAAADSARLHATPFCCQNGHKQWFLQSDGQCISLEGRVAEAKLLREEIEMLRLRVEQTDAALTVAADGVAGLRETMPIMGAVPVEH